MPFSRSVFSSARATIAAPSARLHREDEGELVSAEASDDVGLAQASAEHAGEADDQLVAGGMAERVVDVLEAVEVDHGERSAAGVAAGASELRLELALEAAAVQQTRQRIVIGHVLESLLVMAAGR